MGPYYRIITSASSLLPLDQSLLDSMEKENTEELKKLDDRLAEAEKTEGESEISDALKARANYLTRIGDKVPISLLVWEISNGSNPHIGSCSWSSKPCSREDARSWFTNRHRSHHRSDWFLLQWQQFGYFEYGQSRKVQLPSLISLVPININITLFQAHRGRRRLGPSKSSKSIQRCSPHLHPSI